MVNLHFTIPLPKQVPLTKFYIHQVVLLGMAEVTFEWPFQLPHETDISYSNYRSSNLI